MNQEDESLAAVLSFSAYQGNTRHDLNEGGSFLFSHQGLAANV